MKIFGICLIKNEEDIIEEVLIKACSWCDNIFVFDTGSTDSTWEKVVALSKKYSSIILYKKETRSYSDDLRSEVFNYYRHLSKEGDWWCKLDSDEVYIDNPKDFLSSVSKFHHVVWNLSVQFYFTNKDLENYELNPSDYISSETESRLKYYLCNHSEARFFRYRNRLTWNTGSWPKHLGIVSPKRIRLKHLQYRSPEQIQIRLNTRQQATQEGHKIFAAYEFEKSWKEKVKDFKEYNTYTIPEEIVLEKNIPIHIESFPVRIAKYFFHILKIYP